MGDIYIPHPSIKIKKGRQMVKNLTIVIPMAGHGTRMRPHTWSKPKPLIGVAGKTSLDQLLDSFSSIPPELTIEYVFIVSPNLGETQIPAYMNEHYPNCKVDYVVQSEMRGQSDAMYLARNFLRGPILMIYSDTLIETDFSEIGNEMSGGIAWVKSVHDPRRFGVAEINENKIIKRLIEKPESMDNDLAVVGCYYFRSGENLVSAIEEQFERKLQLKGEYFLVDAINIMIEKGLKMRVQPVETWLDTGTIDATLDTNRHLLQSRRYQSDIPTDMNVKIIPPVFIHAEAEVTKSQIGPNVSIGPKCVVADSKIEDSILEEGAYVKDANLIHSFLGCNVLVKGKGMDSEAASLNIGDDSTVEM
jgi:glucose-1-phosphate thymidylyltransferase